MNIFKKITQTIVALTLVFGGLFASQANAMIPYSIEITSETSVTSESYSLYATVLGMDPSNESLYYTLNTLDVTKKVKMDRIPFTSRFFTKTPATLNEGKNTFIVFIVNNTSGQVSGISGSSKIVTVTYTPAPDPLVDPVRVSPGENAVITPRDNPPAEIPRTLEYVKIEEGTALTLRVGESMALHATALYSDGTSANVTREVTWTSTAASNVSVGTVSGLEGLTTGRAEGQETIKAILDPQQEDGSASIVITVLPKTADETTNMLDNSTDPTNTPTDTMTETERLEAELAAINDAQENIDQTEETTTLDASIEQQRQELARRLEEARNTEDTDTSDTATENSRPQGFIWFIGGLLSALLLSGIIALVARKKNN